MTSTEQAQRKYHAGARVSVIHDQGTESGVVVGVLTDGRVHVRFADGTRSSWPQSRVRPTR